MNGSKFSGAVVLAAILLINGCGGDSDGGSTPAPAADELFGGLWFGTFTTTGTGSDDSVVGISTDAGEFQFLFDDLLIQASGTVVVDGTEVMGNGFAYAPFGETFTGGDTVTAFSFTGTLDSRTSISGEWEIAAGEMGTFDLAYDQDHQGGAAISRVAQIWTQFDEFLNPVIVFDIDNNGTIFGQSFLGASCTSTGTITVPDPAFNVYEWNTTVSGGTCPIAGDYEGLGTLGENLAPDDSLIILASNAARALFIPLEL